MPVERVVCLGSPLVDSQPARLLQRFDWGRPLVGKTLIEGVLEKPLGEWAGPQQVGVIAGTAPYGTANLFMPLSDPNDGVVAAEETRLPGIADHVELPVSHSGLLFSDTVVPPVAAFLRGGSFAAAYRQVRSGGRPEFVLEFLAHPGRERRGEGSLQVADRGM